MGSLTYKKTMSAQSCVSYWCRGSQFSEQFQVWSCWCKLLMSILTQYIFLILREHCHSHFPVKYLQLNLLQNQVRLQILEKILEILMLHALYVPYIYKILGRTLLCFVSIASFLELAKSVSLGNLCFLRMKICVGNQTFLMKFHFKNFWWNHSRMCITSWVRTL